MVHLQGIKLENLFVSEHASIREAMAVIDHGLCKTALVVDEDRYLKGVVADSDIRRALLKGFTLESETSQIMNRNPLSMPEGLSKKQARQLVQHHKRDILPVLNKQGCVVDAMPLVESLEAKKFENEVILMAGGRGERLMPLTREKPKPMIEVGKKPMLEILLENFLSNGFSKFRISVNYLGDSIEEYFGDGSKWGASISYISEDKPLGTAGALSLMQQQPQLPFIIMNCDVLTKVDFELLLEHHNGTNSLATMCVTQQDVAVPFGVVEHDNFTLEKVIEKPIYTYLINAGIYVLSPEVLSLVEHDTFLDMPTLVERVQKEMGQATLFPLREYWLDVGTHRSLEQANNDFNNQF